MLVSVENYTQNLIKKIKNKNICEPNFNFIFFNLQLFEDTFLKQKLTRLIKNLSYSSLLT